MARKREATVWMVERNYGHGLWMPLDLAYLSEEAASQTVTKKDLDAEIYRIARYERLQPPKRKEKKG